MAEQNTINANNTLGVTSSEAKTETIDSLTHDILIMRLDSLQKDMAKELEELKDRQREVSELHDLIAKINRLTNKDGEVKVDEELRALLEKAVTSEENSEAVNALKIDKDSLKIKNIDKKYSSEDRQRLIENIRMHIEDLNTQNDMQLQTVTKFTNERYETYQMARAILKPHDDDKQQKARAIAGR